MSWIKTIPENEATETLAELYDQSNAKFGHVINLVKIQSLSPESMSIGKQLYTHLMTKPGGLSRLQRVLIATVVSKINGCYY